MSQRIDYFNVGQTEMNAMLALEKVVRESGLEHSLIHLVKMRASQINGCAYCIQMHSTDARKNGESEERLYLLDAWEESSLYSPRERAALRWTEALTLISEGHAPDGTYQEMAKHFSPPEQVKLSLLIATINAWNRLAIGFRAEHAKAKKAA
jgi:AhpD family alkylhydroperoxidase